VDWIAAVVVFVCLVVLAVDSSRRWGRPGVHIDVRSPWTWGVAAVLVAVVALLSVID
jgi:hypothetical protein